MKFFKSALSLLVVVALFCLAMFGLNFYTGPLVEANQAGDALAPLLAVMPEGTEPQPVGSIVDCLLLDIPEEVVL